MEDIINLSLVLFFFLLVVFIACFIIQVFMKIFGRKKKPNKSIEKELKNHSSTQENSNQNDSGTNANDAEANWTNAVMTTAFITASIKSAHDHSDGNNHDDVDSQD
ncbi:hypothetical protein COJ93_19085 [Bacillus anthracis]|uniref:DUF4834 family protein n=1 Tax=Bacillus cereus group TaxID=86661 RepID=UPI000BED5B6D|nr:MULTISPECIES: DUF4834 family protein [Bacillus cereus group]PEF66116.1 hypothetical protein CON33_14910 [Bacillus anthracis]PFA94376.1 hypothetical protein CN385_29560 [Bacillus anthracis]PFP35480.1 hypothetical protein COJ93_19085 [Bacillus anthracis]PGP13468.1 hypothetical protein CN994_26810 [Bacillus anthracis]TXR64193.1 DUF4834 family protein [Bacillus sp. AY18-3]